MKKIFTGLFAVAALGFGISQASAHDDMRRHHGHSGFSFGIILGDPYGRDPFWDGVPVRPVMRACSVERASQKARNMGIRHQTIFKSPYTIKVVGTSHGNRVQVTFARDPGCPVIRY
jgi:hypothetical protein